MDEDEEYFIKSYSGGYIPYGKIEIDYGSFETVFVCRSCSAVVVDPEQHEKWHKESK